MEEMRAAEAAAARKREREEAEAKRERESNERLSRELKGKDFTYDADGNVIVVSGVALSKLPPQFNTVGVALSADPATEEAPPTPQRQVNPRHTNAGDSPPPFPLP